MSSLSEKYGEGTYNDFVYKILSKLITQMGVKQEEITVLEQIHLLEKKEVSIDNMLLIYDTIVN
jgi:hypothetical protein